VNRGNLFFEVFKVPKIKGIVLDKIISLS